MTPLRTLVFAFSLSMALAIPTFAFAGEAQDLVQARHTEVITMLHKPASTERDKQVAAVLGGLFDYDSIAERSLGAHWAELDGDQKNEFVSVLKQLIQKSLEKSLKTTLKYDVKFLGEEPALEGVMVKTKASSNDSREEPISIDYQLHKTGNASNTGTAWRAVDVITEGSSMVKNYKSQFNRIIAKDGFATLLKKMRAKLTQTGGDPSGGAQ